MQNHFEGICLRRGPPSRGLQQTHFAHSPLKPNIRPLASSKYA